MALTYFLVKFVSFLTGERSWMLFLGEKDITSCDCVMTCASFFFALEGYIYLEAPMVFIYLNLFLSEGFHANGILNTVESP